MTKSNIVKKGIYTGLAAMTLMGVGATTTTAFMTAQPVSATTNGADSEYSNQQKAVPVEFLVKDESGKTLIDYNYNNVSPYIIEDALDVTVPELKGLEFKSISSGFTFDPENGDIEGKPNASSKTVITIIYGKADTDDGASGLGSGTFDNNDWDANGNGATYSASHPGMKTYDGGETWVPGTNQEIMDSLKNQSNADDQVVRGDDTEVQNAIDEANSLDESQYTAASYKNLMSAVDQASELLYDDFAEQPKMDAGAEMVNNAIKHLVKNTKPQGPAISADKYVTLTSKNYKIWTSFDFNKVKHYSKNYYQKTYHVKTIYNHENGSTYLSLYDSKGKWFGYINETGTKTAKGAQGTPISAKQYVTLTNKTSTIWSGFDFKTAKHYSKNYYQKTYLVKTIYNHANGSTYYSLYDSKGKWFGYINANGTKKASGQQGIAISYKKTVTIKKSGYTIWGGFFNKKRGTSTKYKNKKLTAKVKYNCANGSTYLSLYSGSKWIGYVNASVAK